MDFAKEGFASEDVKTLSFNVDIENESYRDKEGNGKSYLKQSELV